MVFLPVLASMQKLLYWKSRQIFLLLYMFYYFCTSFWVRITETKAYKIMAVTRLKRKGLRNKLKAQKRNERIKQLNKQPPIKNVDVEALKAQFEKKK